MTVVAGLIGSLFAGIKSVAAAGGIGAFLLRSAASIALSALSARLRGRRPEPGIRAAHTQTGGVNPEAFVLGQYATHGSFAAPPMSHGTAGRTPNAFLSYVIEVANLARHGLEGIILDGEVAPILEDAPHADYGRRLGGRFAGRAWVRWHDGTQTTADAMLLAKFPGTPGSGTTQNPRPWGADMIGQGIAYAVLTFLFDREIYKGFPNVRLVVGGIPLYDPRSDSSAGGLGAQRWDDPATWERTLNPAVMIYNILRGIRLPGGEVWGGEAQAADLPFARWALAMDRCDATLDDGAGGTEPAFRAGLEVQLSDEPFAVIEELLEACDGRMTEAGGAWLLRVGPPELPVRFISDDDILITEAQELDPFPAPDQTFNAISASHPDPAALWEARDAAPVLNPAWEAEDGHRRLTADVSLPAVPFPVQVARIMRARIADHRRMRRHVLPLPNWAATLQPLDVIAWTSTRHGYVTKWFEVHEVTRDLQRQGARVSLREVDPADYVPPIGLVRPQPADPTPARPGPQTVPGWTAIAAFVPDAAGQPRQPRIDLVWDADAALDARGLRVEYRLSGLAASAVELPPFDARAGRATLHPVLPATVYEVRARWIVDRPTVWTHWAAVTTPDLGLTQADLAVELAALVGTLNDWIAQGAGNVPLRLGALDTGLTAEAQARAQALAAEAQARSEALAGEAQARTLALTTEAEARADLAALTADRWRDTRSRIAALSAEVIEAISQAERMRHQLRTTLVAEIGTTRAAFDQRIDVVLTDLSAAVQRVTTIEAQTGATNAQVTQLEAALSDGLNALGLLITQISVGAATAFDTAAIWYFDLSPQGWMGAPTPPVAVDGWLRPGPGSNAVSPGALGVATATYGEVRARLRRVGTPVWTGQLWWAGTGQDWAAARRVTILDPAWSDGLAVVTWPPAWTGVVDRIRLDLASGTDASNYVEVDWIGVGRTAPGASTADMTREAQARVASDAALASDIATVNATVQHPVTGLGATAQALGGQQAQIAALGSNLNAQSTRIDGVEAEIAHPVTGLGPLAQALDTLEGTVVAGDDAQASTAQAIRRLRSALRQVEGEIIEGMSVNDRNARQSREAVATALQTLITTTELTDAGLVALVEVVTQLEAAIPGLATAQVAQSLTTRVTQTEGTLTALVGQHNTLSATVAHPVTGLGATGTIANQALAQAETTAGGLSTLVGQHNTLSATVAHPVTGLGAIGTVAQQAQAGVQNLNGVTQAHAGILTSLSAATDPANPATANFRMQVASGPTGYSRIGLQTRINGGGDWRGAALFLDTAVDPTIPSRVVVAADQLVYSTPNGLVQPMVVTAGGMTINVPIQSANYAESGGVPVAGFRLDPETSQFRVANLITREALVESAASDRLHSARPGMFHVSQTNWSDLDALVLQLGANTIDEFWTISVSGWIRRVDTAETGGRVVGEAGISSRLRRTATDTWNESSAPVASPGNDAGTTPWIALRAAPLVLGGVFAQAEVSIIFRNVRLRQVIPTDTFCHADFAISAVRVKR